MVTDDTALEAVTRAPEGLLAGWRPGAILVEMSTVGPAVIERLAADGRGARRRPARRAGLRQPNAEPGQHGPDGVLKQQAVDQEQVDQRGERGQHTWNIARLSRPTRPSGPRART